jgi:hypothetical protein
MDNTLNQTPTPTPTLQKVVLIAPTPAPTPTPTPTPIDMPSSRADINYYRARMPRPDHIRSS